MVDSVKSAISRIESPKVKKAEINSADNTQVSRKAHGQSSASAPRSVQLKSAELSASVKELASVAPVDTENVNRIKSAIKEGKYPIDIDKISDALMDAYRELKS